MNRLDEYGYAGLYKALKHKYKYALSTNLPCVSRHSQFHALNSASAKLVALAPGLRPERRFAPLARG